MYNVLIVGHGYVGSAVSSVFVKDNVVIVDPKFNKNKIQDFKDTKFDAVFVCVDTPKNENFILLSTVLNDLNKFLIKGTIVCCKSTATPQFYYNAEKKYKRIKVVFSPEYLSHWNNINDFKNQKFVIVGGDKTSCITICNILKDRLLNLKNIKITDIRTAALVKYAENGFLAYKVTFFNELYNIHKTLKLPSTYRQLADLLVLDSRIGDSHTEVPGRDGKRGWGGHCFTKDNYEFAKFTKSSLLKFIIKINTKHRKKSK